MIRYKCPKCGAKLENEDSLGGQKDTCPMCQFTHAVPPNKEQQRQLKAQEKQARA
jgi:DNA-directed RNA polymerase subunit RPC12/RpoP